MPTYDLPTSDTINASNFGSIFAYINTVTFGWVSRLILIALYLIIIFGYYQAKKDFIGGIAIAGFGTFVVGFLFWLGGFVAGLDLAFAFGVMIIGVAWILLDKQGTA